jgi:hypothetical protein
MGNYITCFKKYHYNFYKLAEIFHDKKCLVLRDIKKDYVIYGGFLDLIIMTYPIIMTLKYWQY